MIHDSLSPGRQVSANSYGQIPAAESWFIGLCLSFPISLIMVHRDQEKMPNGFAP